MALQENEKVLTTLNAAPVFAKIKEDIAAIDTSAYVTNEALDAKGFITTVPDEYVTEEELLAKGYITEAPAVDIPVATSDEILALYTGVQEG